MAKAEKNAKSKRSAAFLREHGRDRVTGNCPLCHNLITNGTIHLLVLCKPKRPMYANQGASKPFVKR
jgi:hypothetical protein